MLDEKARAAIKDEIVPLFDCAEPEAYLNFVIERIEKILRDGGYVQVKPAEGELPDWEEMPLLACHITKKTVWWEGWTIGAEEQHIKDYEFAQSQCQKCREVKHE